MSTWLYIASGIVAFIVFVLMFVLMTLADDFEQVNGTENNAHYAQGLEFKMTNTLNKDSKKFWMVWNQSTGYTHQKHYVLNDAVDEAKRLGVRKYGQKFVVLESICEIVPVPEVKLNMLD